MTLKIRNLVICIVGITMLLSGCQSMRPVDLSGNEPLIAKVRTGDHVRIWMRDGRKLDLQLTAVEPDALVSGEQRVPLKDVERIERRQINWTRTTMLLVGLGLVAAVVAVAVAAASRPVFGPVH